MQGHDNQDCDLATPLSLHSPDDDRPKNSQGFDQFWIIFSQFLRVGLTNGESIRHGPVLEDCPVLN